MTKQRNIDSVFAEFLKNTNFDGKPNSEIMALGMIMNHWLNTEISDSGILCDSGAGFDSYDLWVNFGGKELLINIRESKKSDQPIGDNL